MACSKLFVCLRKLKYLCVCSILFLFSSTNSIASIQDFEISGALGFSNLDANNGSYQFVDPPDLEDTIRTSRTSRSLNYKFGIGYNLFTERLSKNKFLNNLLLELNFYRFAVGSVYGKVYPNNDVNYNIDFQLNIDSNNRLMLDIKPSLCTWRGFSPYAILGAGVSWIKTNYHEYDYDNSAPRTIVSSSTNKNFVIEGGCGLNYAINKHTGLFLEYLFTRFGKIKTYGATFDDLNFPISSPAFTNMYTNTALLGLYIRM